MVVNLSMAYVVIMLNNYPRWLSQPSLGKSPEGHRTDGKKTQPRPGGCYPLVMSNIAIEHDHL